MLSPFSIDYRPPFLLAEFAEPQRLLSWSLNKPGFRIASRVVWIEVRNADLPPDIKPERLLAERLAAANLSDAIALVTSRDLSRYTVSEASVEGHMATCVATVGLSNGEWVGKRFAEAAHFGTINTLVHVSSPLSKAALVEVISMATAARTTAILDAGIQRNGVAITGTGTDCIVVASPARGRRERFAGMHMAVGEAVGAAVYRTIHDGANVWRADFEAMLQSTQSAERVE